jgi:predicted nucleotidyltransferase
MCEMRARIDGMPAARELAIPIPHEQIAEFCRKWGIRKLSFFGSIVRDDFTDTSDVDVLVEFKDGEGPRGWDIVRTEAELAQIVGRKVDLVETHLLNRWIRREVLAEAVEEYVEAQ